MLEEVIHLMQSTIYEMQDEIEKLKVKIGY